MLGSAVGGGEESPHGTEDRTEACGRRLEQRPALTAGAAAGGDEAGDDLRACRDDVEGAGGAAEQQRLLPDRRRRSREIELLAEDGEDGVQ